MVAVRINELLHANGLGKCVACVQLILAIIIIILK